MIGRVTSALSKILDFSCAFVMAVMVILVISQVLFRYVFLNPLGWSEEVGTMTMVWITFIGSYLAFRDDQHMRVNLFYKDFSPNLKKACLLGGNFLMIILNAFIIKLGMDYVLAFQTMKTPYLEIPQSYFYLIIPVAAVLWTMQIILNSIATFKRGA